jgi:glutaminyl-tRNA synthetase
MEAPGSWEDYVNPESETVIAQAMVDEHLLNLPVYTSFQAERVGYFMVDPDTDSAAGKLVLNRVVTLKESSDAKSVRK